MKKLILSLFCLLQFSCVFAQSIEISAENASLNLKNSSLKVSGANKSAFIHTVNPGVNDGGSVSIIDNPLCNNNLDVILMVTTFLGYTNNSVHVSSQVGVFYDTILNKWKLISLDLNTIPTGAKFYILVINI